MPFNTVCNTKIETFQYYIIHKFIPCNDWLHNLNIKIDKLCTFCSSTDDIPHFLITGENTNKSGRHGHYVGNKLRGFNIRETEYIIVNIIFGFPENRNNSKIIILVLNMVVKNLRSYLKRWICVKSIALLSDKEFIYM